MRCLAISSQPRQRQAQACRPGRLVEQGSHPYRPLIGPLYVAGPEVGGGQCISEDLKMDNEASEIRKALLPELYAEIRWWRTVEQWSFTIFATALVGALAWSTQNAGRIKLGSLVFLTAALLTLWTTFTRYLHGNLRRSMTTRRILHSIQIMAGITEITQVSEQWSHKSDIIREHAGTLHFWYAATILSLLLCLEAGLR